MNLPEYFISCDWGTSNFRLRLVKTQSLEVISERISNKGVKVLYQEFEKQEQFNQIDFFSNYLLSQIQLLPKKHQTHPIVSAGMVTANIGLYELGYAEMPFGKSGSTLKSKKIALTNGLEILLISGIKDSLGMMRGEETQALGLIDEIKNISSEAILLLPGTHSKHLTYKDNEFTELKSYMTGELFEIISQKSILSNSIVKTNTKEINETAFIKGLQLGVQGNLTSSLFSIRASDLLGTSKKEDNYYFLSGLIIGDELAYLKNEKKTIFLAAPSPLANLYEIALKHIIKSKNYKIFNSSTTEKAILIGQLKLLKTYE